MKLAYHLIRFKPEVAYAVLALFFGVLFIFVVPPFFVQDEMHHFYRAYQISDLHIIGEKKQTDSYQVGGMLPQSIIDTGEKLVHISYGGGENSLTVSFLESLFSQTLHPEVTKFANFNNTVLYAPFSYLPSTCGIVVGKVLQLSPVMLLYLARLFTLFCSVVLIYFAIKIMPALKWSAFLLALMPLTFWEVASSSYDSLTISLSMLLIATFMYYALSKVEIKKLDIVLIFLLTSLVSLSKIAYFPLLFLYFLLSPKQIGGRKKYWVILLALFVVNIALISIWAYLVHGIYAPFNGMNLVGQNQTIDPHSQLIYLYKHPLHIFTVIESYFAVIAYSAHSYLQNFVGILGYLDVPQMFLTDLYFLMLFVLPLFSGRQEVKLGIKVKAIMTGVFFLNLFVVLLFIYLSSSPVGALAISGMRQRYLIPFSLLFFAIFQRQISLDIDLLEHYKPWFIPIFSFVALTVTLLAVINKYYYL